MAIAMARNGGIGIIHRYLATEEQVRTGAQWNVSLHSSPHRTCAPQAKEVEKVKRAESYVIDSPYCIQPSAQFKELDEVMDEHGVSSILVVEKGKLAGVVTRRDVALIEDPREPVSKVRVWWALASGLSVHRWC